MPKLPCPCGFVHDLSPIPDDGWRAIRDKDMEAYIQNERAYSEGFHAPVGSTERDASSAGGRETIRMSTLLYECPKCGRIMWRKTRGGDFQIYAPEKPAAYPCAAANPAIASLLQSTRLVGRVAELGSFGQVEFLGCGLIGDSDMMANFLSEAQTPHTVT